jgi:hypothetical protein
MKRALLTLITLLLLLGLTNNVFIANAQEAQQETQIDSDQIASDEPEDDAPAQRVMRLSFVQGDVSFLRAGVKEWANAVENLPLLAGDQIYAGRSARAELQLGRGSYIRLSENTALTIAELSDTESQFDITEGIAIIRLERLQTAFGRFEVDTPNAALVLQQDGLYRVNVRGDNDSEVIVRRGAAEVSTLDGSFKVREGYKLLIDTSPTSRLEIALDDSRDDWDQWSYDRDVAIDRTSTSLSPDYVSDYETTYSSFYGASDLSNYGTWTDDAAYGHCWRPRVDSSWVPYRDGQWLWVPATGWTWLAQEPWGWAPYHYGRWVYSPALGWLWAPGFGPRYRNNYHSYFRWRPALVFFFDAPTARGHYVGWYPLRPGERWRNWNRRDNDHAHLRYPNPRDGWRRPDNDGRRVRTPRDSRGVTLLPVDGFTRPDRSRVRPVVPDKDMRDWISKGARPGLPEIAPTPVATAPSFREGNERRNRIAIPPGEIISRPVVTRNRPKDSATGISAPRERRLILPRTPVYTGEPSGRKERNNGRDRSEESRPKPPSVAPGEKQDQNDSNRVIRVPRPVPADQVDNDNSRSERKAKRDKEDSNLQRPVDKPEKQADADDSSKERQRKQPIYLPAPNEKQHDNRDNEDRQGERKPRDEARPRPREDSAPREDSHQRSEERPKPRERVDSTPRQERPQPPPSENKSQPREERQQQKEERRQERREERQERKKP